MTPSLELDAVSKHFGTFTAVDNVSFSAKPGEIVGYLGPNGAGKSTSLRMALGIMAPDSGEARLFGERPSLKSLRRVGFLPEERGLYRRMTPKAIISYFAKLKGLSGRDARRRATELLDSAGLGAFATAKVSKLSKGMAQKVQILSTLAHAPDLLILDEPFSGLDPVNQGALEDLIRAENERGATIVFSTHVMEHAERLCDRIVLIAKGQKRFDGTIEEAIQLGASGARIAVSNGFDLGGALAARGFSAEQEPVLNDNQPATWWKVSLTPGQDAQQALQVALDLGAPIAGFSPDQARLRDIFVSLSADADTEEALVDA